MLRNKKENNPAVLGIFEGECADANITNLNGLDITQEVWETVFNSDEYKEGISEGWYIGFLGHPEDPGCQEFKDACIVMTEGHIDEDGKVYGKFNLIDTPVGRIVKTFQDAGVNFGISVRGAGDIENNSVDPDTFVFRGFDLVAFPAYPNSIPTFTSLAASSDINKRKQYKAICNAVTVNLKNIESKCALKEIQKQFAPQSEIYSVISARTKAVDNLNKSIKSAKFVKIKPDDDVMNCDEIESSTETDTVEIPEDADDITAKRCEAITKLYMDAIDECNSLKAENKKLKNDLERTQLKAARKIDSVKRITAGQEREIREIQKESEREIEKLQNDSEREIRRIKANTDKKLNKKDKETKTKIQQIKANHKLQIDRMQSDYEREISEIEANHKSQIAKIESSHKSQLDKIYASHDDEIESYNRELDKVQSNVDKIQEDTDAQIKDLVAKHKNKISRLQEDSNAQLDERDEIITNLQDDYNSLEYENENLRNNYNTLKRDLSDLRKDNSALKDDNSALKQKNLNYKKKIENAQAELEDRYKEIDELNASIEETVKQSDAIQAIVSNRDAKIQDLKSELSSVKKMLNEYQNSYANLYANAVGVNTKNVPITSSTSVKQLQSAVNRNMQNTGDSESDIDDIYVDDANFDDTLVTM